MRQATTSTAATGNSSNQTGTNVDTARSAGERQQDLLQKEIAHRSINDMQMVGSLLALQSRHSKSVETQEALRAVRDRVMVLASARAAFMRDSHPTLESALQQVCIALQSQAEPYGMMVAYKSETIRGRLSAAQITALALVVNEVATNAIKHAFKEKNGGRILIEACTDSDQNLIITVDDDGSPFPEPLARQGSGLGFDLVRRLVQSANGQVIFPSQDSKCFEIRVPLHREPKELERRMEYVNKDIENERLTIATNKAVKELRRLAKDEHGAATLAETDDLRNEHLIKAERFASRAWSMGEGYRRGF